MYKIKYRIKSSYVWNKLYNQWCYNNKDYIKAINNKIEQERNIYNGFMEYGNYNKIIGSNYPLYETITFPDIPDTLVYYICG